MQQGHTLRGGGPFREEVLNILGGGVRRPDITTLDPAKAILLGPDFSTDFCYVANERGSINESDRCGADHWHAIRTVLDQSVPDLSAGFDRPSFAENIIGPRALEQML